MIALRTLLLIAATACGAASPSASPTPGHAAAPPPFEPRAFRVEVTGDGPPVILIPGLASSGETWTTTVDHLRARYTCHVLTLAGFAGVPPIEGKLLPAVEAELARYIASRHLTSPVIIGHSLGGTLALLLAADHPRLVGPVVIVDAMPFFGAMLSAASADEAGPIIARMRSGMAAQTHAQWEASVRSGQSTNALTAAPADQQRLITWSLASDRATVQDTKLELFGLDLRPRLGQVTAPALVIGTWVGWRGPDETSAQRPVYAQHFRDQWTALPHAHLALSDTARHFVMFDDLPWFLDELDRFLANPDDAARDRGLVVL